MRHGRRRGARAGVRGEVHVQNKLQGHVAVPRPVQLGQRVDAADPALDDRQPVGKVVGEWVSGRGEKGL